MNRGIVEKGRYRHYDGMEYIVLGVIRNAQTDEISVVCRANSGDRSLWIHPEGSFFESVEIGGRRVPRFQRIEAS